MGRKPKTQSRLRIPVVISNTVKESIKTALAMTITYGIALSMDWDKPYWGGFAVAFVSLSTIGQSINKAALRLLGTLLAVAVALALIALFPQQRWLFMVCLSIWTGLCTYLMAGAKHQYFWNVCGFVTVIICMSAGPDAVNAFQVAVLRAQETGLGIVVYSVVAILLWPSNSRGSFDATTLALTSTQHRLFEAYLDLMQGQGDADQARQLRAQAMQQQAQFSQLLDASEADSYEVWECRHQWRRCHSQLLQLSEALERWRDSFAGASDLDLPRLLPGLSEFGVELDRRFAGIEAMFSNQAPASRPAFVELGPDEDALHSLSPFNKSALGAVRGEMCKLVALSESLFASVSDIRGFGDATHEATESVVPHVGFVPDPDRFTAVVRVVLTLWLAYLAVIFINDIPGGFGLVSMTSALAMNTAGSPQLSVSALFVPVGGSVLFASLVYIFVMPALSSFLGLGPLIFAVTFAICYLFAAPKQGLARAFGLAMFVNIASITNHQTYSFFVVSTTALMFPLIFGFLAITAYFPLSQRPEKAMQRLLERFFHSAQSLMVSLHWESQQPLSRRQHWWRAFHAKEVSAIPSKLGTWAKFLDTSVVDSPAQLQALVGSLQALSYRISGLLEARSHSQLAHPLRQQLLVELETWGQGVQEVLQGLSIDPAGGQHQVLRARLDLVVEKLEARIQETIDNRGEGELSALDGENFYRLLGALRSVSEALIDYARVADTIHWAHWREERFA
jgi:hypothetical protein